VTFYENFEHQKIRKGRKFGTDSIAFGKKFHIIEILFRIFQVKINIEHFDLGSSIFRDSNSICQPLLTNPNSNALSGHECLSFSSASEKNFIDYPKGLIN